MPDALTDLLFGPEPIIALQQLLDPGVWLFPLRLVSFFGVNWGAVLVLGLSLWLWGRKTAYAVGSAVFLEGVVSLVLNQLFFVPRPHEPGVIVYEHVSLSSFPSGHVFTTAVLWGALWVRGRIPLWVAALPVLAVSVGRIYLGTHYLGDVLGGLVFAAALLALHARLWPWVRSRMEGRSFRVYAGLALAGVVAGVAATFVIGDNVYEWGAVGIAVGASVGFLLEYRLLHYEPGDLPPTREALRIGMGVAGVLVPFLASRFVAEDAYLLTAVLTGTATLWAVLLAPWLLARVGLGETENGRAA